MNNTVKTASALLITASLAFFFFKKEKPKANTKAAETSLQTAKSIPPPAAAPTPETKPALPAKPATAPQPANAPIPTNDEEIDFTSITLDFFEPNVFPLMSSLASPCAVICNPTTYDWGMAYRGDPEYENKFFMAHGPRAFDDSEFRMRAEYLRGEAQLYTPQTRLYKRGFSKRLAAVRDGDGNDFILKEKPRWDEYRKEYQKIEPQLQILRQVFQEFRRIRESCNRENPSDVQKQCLQMMPPNGQFPLVKR